MSDKYKSRSERTKVKKQQNKKKTKRKSTWKKVITSLVIIFGVIAIALGIGVFSIIRDAPELDPEKLRLAQNPEIYDRNGEVFSNLIAVENRKYVDFDEIPPVLIDAVLSVEDVRFYDHFGLDLRRIGGAIVANITKGFGSEGASTITQQVVKNLFLSFDKTWTRKIQEQYLAIKLEQKYTKNQILEMYLNINNYANSRYGVAEAANFYFSKDLSELTIEDAALLAGIPQRPSYFDPLENPEAAEQRRNLVIYLMELHGKITAEEAEAAKSISVEEQLNINKRDQQPYQAFLNQVLKEVEAIEGIEPSDIYTSGMKIYTTLDQDLQKYVEHVMQTDEVIQWPNEKYQAGVTLLDTKTGEVLAIGGMRQRAEGVKTWNWATNPRRQPGSVIKPILDYGPAVDQFKWSTYHQLLDDAHTYSNGTPVRNVDRSYRGEISLRKAMETSRNVTAVKAFQEVGIDKAKEFGERLGLELDTIQEPYAIGGFTTGVSSFQMAGAFAAFGNNGEYNAPHTVTKVEFQNGHTIHLKPDPVIAMNDYTAFIITDVMKTVMEGSEGTGRRAAVPGVPIAGKTGSSNFSEEEIKRYNFKNGIKDSWMVGYSTELTASVWTGYPSNEDGYIQYDGYQQHIAKYIFKEVMAYAHQNRKASDFPQPNSVVKVGIEKSTGLLPSPFTPQSEIIYEYFVKGTEPTEQSEQFIAAEAIQNLTANYDEENDEITISWEYPEDLVEMFSFKIELKASDQEEFSLIDITKDLQFIIGNPIKGETYSIRVTAVADEFEEIEGYPAAVNISIPEEEEEDPIGDLIDDIIGGNDDENNSPGNGNDDGDENNNQPPNDSNNEQAGNENDQNNNGRNGNSN